MQTFRFCFKKRKVVQVAYPATSRCGVLRVRSCGCVGGVCHVQIPMRLLIPLLLTWVDYRIIVVCKRIPIVVLLSVRIVVVVLQMRPRFFLQSSRLSDRFGPDSLTGFSTGLGSTLTEPTVMEQIQKEQNIDGSELFCINLPEEYVMYNISFLTDTIKVGRLKLEPSKLTSELPQIMFATEV